MMKWWPFYVPPPATAEQDHLEFYKTPSPEKREKKHKIILQKNMILRWILFLMFPPENYIEKKTL